MQFDSKARYRLLLDINNSIIREKNRSDLFRSLSNEIGKIIEHDRLSILLYDPQTESLPYFAVADGIKPDVISENNRPLDKAPIAAEVIRSKKPFVITNLDDYLHWPTVRSMKNSGLKATMSFPLMVRDQVLGTLNFSFVNIPPDLDALISFLNELTQQVSIAVQSLMSHIELENINKQLVSQKEFLQKESPGRQSDEGLYFASQTMKKIIRQAELYADSDISVLITGETGTGKDMIARYIHNKSKRKNGLFVKVNCPALIHGLFESELFGHAKGAFTGATNKRIGRFEIANGGTVFLDEIAELDVALQAKLLHVLQDKAFERVGESRSFHVDFRVISATNKIITSSIKKNEFRADLYYRLNTVSLHIPPLRDRVEDIPLLVDRILQDYAREMHRPIPIFSKASQQMINHYSWPGNVRELKNMLHRFFIIRSGQIVTTRDIEDFISDVGGDSNNSYPSLVEMERKHIIGALENTKGVVSGPSGAAALLGIKRQTLEYRMKKYNLKISDFKN